MVRKKCPGSQKAKASNSLVSLTECVTLGKLLDLPGLELFLFVIREIGIRSLILNHDCALEALGSYAQTLPSDSDLIFKHSPLWVSGDVGVKHHQQENSRLSGAASFLLYFSLPSAGWVLMTEPCRLSYSFCWICLTHVIIQNSESWGVLGGSTSPSKPPHVASAHPLKHGAPCSSSPLLFSLYGWACLNFCAM